MQHAVVEYSEQEQCFVLQDLNTQQGTYVNDCRVQNAAVRLASGDLIRFGGDGNSYELHVDTIGQVTYFGLLALIQTEDLPPGEKNVIT